MHTSQLGGKLGVFNIQRKRRQQQSFSEQTHMNNISSIHNSHEDNEMQTGNAWQEKELLGNLQFDFRDGRRIEDNLFVLTRCIEMAGMKQRELWACFRDIEKAYEYVAHNLLWQQLEYLRIDNM